MARAGWNVAAIDMLYFGERQAGFWTDFSEREKQQRLYGQPGVYLAWITQMVRDIRRTIDLLVSETHADPRRIGLVGQSRGATPGAIAAAVDQRLRPVALLFSGHSATPETAHLAPACPANFIGRVSPRPLLMLNSDNDPYLDLGPAVRPLMSLAPEPKDTVWTHGGHMTFTDADLATVMGWLKKQIQ